MEGLIEEGKEAIDEEEEGEAYDIGLIGAGARVEHYEIAGYTAVIAMMNGLGLEEAAGHLAETLNEENAALEKLEGKIQELIAVAAQSGTSDDEETDEGDQKETAKPQLAKASRFGSNETLNDLKGVPHVPPRQKAYVHGRDRRARSKVRQDAIGTVWWRNGELAAAMQYSIQGLNCEDAARKDLLMDIGTKN